MSWTARASPCAEIAPATALRRLLQHATFTTRRIDRHLRTGAHDELSCNRPGADFLARARRADAAARDALAPAAPQRTARAVAPAELAGIDLSALTRAMSRPRVLGLFPGHEQDTVLGVPERSVVLLTPGTVEAELRTTPRLGTVWDLANLHLLSRSAEPLSESGQAIVGPSAETTCLVAIDYFSAPSCLDDFVVHEAAHMFHNCKRRTIRLNSSARRERLLDVAYRKRATFACACERFGRIRKLGDSRATRTALPSELEQGPPPPED